MKILDIGGGGGASTLAIIDYIVDKNIEVDKLDIVDRSIEQLSITKSIVSPQGKAYNLSFRHTEAHEYLKTDNLEYDFIFAGNFLCEVRESERVSLLILLRKALNKKGQLLVVERTESGVYESIQESYIFSQKKYMYKNVRYKIPFNNEFFGFIDKANSFSVSDYTKKEYTLRYALYE